MKNIDYTQDINTHDMSNHAKNILKQNSRGTYTIPTDGLYPYQWNWDSAFVAWGLSTFDVNRGWDELHCLFSGQWKNGMVPHILFHQQDDRYFPGPDMWKTDIHTQYSGIQSSGISQPPLVASFALHMYYNDPHTGIYHLQKLYAKIKKWHTWFYQHRCDNGVVVSTHPWESGRDNAPDWDMAVSQVKTHMVGDYTRCDTTYVNADMRPTKIDYDRFLGIIYTARAFDWNQADIRKSGQFWVGDPTLSFILLRANKDLFKIAKILGEYTTDIAHWIDTITTGIEQLWCDKNKTYCAIDMRTNTHSGVVSNASFLCWYAGVDNPHMIQHLDRILSITKYGIPSCDPTHAGFDSMRYWRGPVWAIMNTLIGIGLADMGYDVYAETLRTHTRDLIWQHGFAEYYDCNTGTPAGGQAFSWTAAVWLVWVNKVQGENNDTVTKN